MQRRVITWTLAAGLLALPALADHEPLGEREPNADEQLGIYEINRARSDPDAYGKKIKLDLANVQARPPLAVNLRLQGSARFHSDLMLDHHEYGHTSDLLGIGPNQMIVDNGYDLFGSGVARIWGTANSVESIFRSVNQVNSASGVVRTFIIDKGVPGAGHRVHLLAINAFTDHREIGFGFSAGRDRFPEFGLPQTLPTKLAAIHTAYVDPTDRFLTGVVFADANGNLRYDKGEGIEGATITVDGEGQTTSLKHGGWSFQTTSGQKVVRCSGGAFSGEAVAMATVGTGNVEIDFHSGQPMGEVGFAWRSGTLPPGPDVAIAAELGGGIAPVAAAFTGSGLEGGTYSWDFGDGDTSEGGVVEHTFRNSGLFPVTLTGMDATGTGSALRLIAVADAAGAGEGTTPPTDQDLGLKKAIVKRKIKKAGKDQGKLVGTIELPGGFSPEGVTVQVCVAGALRTFTLDKKGKAKLDDKSKLVLKAKYPKDGSGVAPGTTAKVVAVLKGDLAAPLEAGGLRNRTETRTVDDVPCAILLGGQPYTATGTMTAKSKAGKKAIGKITPAE